MAKSITVKNKTKNVSIGKTASRPASSASDAKNKDSQTAHASKANDYMTRAWNAISQRKSK
jgi:pectin methylesterase-like acyl-CoA thioesterase